MRRVMDKVSVRCVSIGVILLWCAAAPAVFPTTLTIAGGITPEDLLVKIDGDLSTFSYYDVGFRVDPVLHNMMYGGATFNIWLFRFGLGAFFSSFAAGGTKYAPGVSGSIGIEAPGVISVYVEYGLNPIIDLNDTGNVYLDYGKLEAAIWLPHIRPRFSMQRKSLRVEPAGTSNLDDSLIRYQVLLDIFFKTFPFLITLGGGQETLTKIITPLSSTAARRERVSTSLFAFMELSWEIHPDWTLFLNFEVPFASQGTAVFRAAAGVKIALFNSN
jgi:hypothetical protein